MLAFRWFTLLPRLEVPLLQPNTSERQTPRWLAFRRTVGTWVLLTLLSSERGTLIEVRHLCLTLSCQEQSLKWGGWGKVSLLPRNTYVLASRSTPTWVFSRRNHLRNDTMHSHQLRDPHWVSVWFQLWRSAYLGSQFSYYAYSRLGKLSAGARKWQSNKHASV